IPKPSLVDDPADGRRVRALTVDLLQDAAGEGHTVLPRSWLIRRARSKALRPACPLGENVLEAIEPSFRDVVRRVATRREPAYQLDQFVECREIIRREIRGRQKGKPHLLVQDWPALVDAGLNQRLPSETNDRIVEERARSEKAAALQILYESRLSVL